MIWHAQVQQFMSDDKILKPAHLLAKIGGKSNSPGRGA